jgi:hypothetical protein
MAYYLVLCKCGHVGRDKYIPIYFTVCAENGEEAAYIARYIPRVKHNHKDAILECKRVDYETFIEQVAINNADPYLLCKSKHEQNAIMSQIKDRLVDEPNYKRSTISYKNQHRPNLYFQSLKYTNIIYDYSY